MAFPPKQSKNFFEILEDHFCNNKPFTNKKIMASLSHDLLSGNFIIDDMAIKTLYPFIDTNFKMIKENDEYKTNYVRRSFGEVLKDLYQNFTTGMSGSEAVSKFENKKNEAYQLIKKEKDYIFAPVVSGKFGEENGFSEDFLEKLANSLGRLNSDDTLNMDIMGRNTDWKQSVSFRDKTTDSEKINYSKVALAFILDDLNAVCEKENYFEDIRPSVVLFSAILTLYAINPETDNKLINPIIEEISPYLYVALEKLQIENSNNADIEKICNAVLELASKTIEKCKDFAKPIDKLFRDLAIAQNLDKTPKAFNDLAIKLDSNGSNYGFAFIDDYDFASYLDSEEHFKEVDNIQEALDLLSKFEEKKEDRASNIVSAMRYFKNQIIASRQDKVIDTPAEAAEMLATFLLIASNADMPKENKLLAEEMFAVPLLQLNKYNDGQIEGQYKEKDNYLKALENLKALEILSGDQLDKYKNYGKKQISILKVIEKNNKNLYKLANLKKNSKTQWQKDIALTLKFVNNEEKIEEAIKTVESYGHQITPETKIKLENFDKNRSHLIEKLKENNDKYYDTKQKKKINKAIDNKLKELLQDELSR